MQMEMVAVAGCRAEEPPQQQQLPPKQQQPPLKQQPPK